MSTNQPKVSRRTVWQILLSSLCCIPFFNSIGRKKHPEIEKYAAFVSSCHEISVYGKDSAMNTTYGLDNVRIPLESIRCVLGNGVVLECFFPPGEHLMALDEMMKKAATTDPEKHSFHTIRLLPNRKVESILN